MCSVCLYFSHVPHTAVTVRATSELGLRDPGASPHTAQPGDTVRVAGPLRGGRAAVQAGPGGPGEDLGPRPSRCRHNAQHSRAGL